MKISNNISLLKNYVPTKNIARTYPLLRTNTLSYLKPADIVEFSKISPLKTALAKLKNITKTEYFSLTEPEKNALRKASMKKRLQPEYIDKTPEKITKEVEKHYFMANAIKTVMDEQYGSGNYVIIPIGRSLSSVSKLLEMQLGENSVKNIPLSRIDQFWTDLSDPSQYDYKLRNFCSLPGFENYKKYLISVGLTKENVETSGKNYIFIDFASSGKSIEAAYNIFTSDKLLGNVKNNITFTSINDIFDALEEKVSTGFLKLKKVDKYSSLKKEIISDLNCVEFKNYSFVDSVYGNLDKVFQKINYNDFCKEEVLLEYRKIFGFRLLDTEYSGKEKPFSKKLTTKKIKSSYPEQKIELWNVDKRKQLTKDLHKDLVEINKLLLLINESKLNKTISEAEKIELTKIKTYLLKMGNSILSSELDSNKILKNYYTTTRAKLFEILEKIRERVSKIQSHA